MKANSNRLDSNKKCFNHSCCNPRKANKTIWSDINKERKPATRQSHQEISLFVIVLTEKKKDKKVNNKHTVLNEYFVRVGGQDPLKLLRGLDNRPFGGKTI